MALPQYKATSAANFNGVGQQTRQAAGLFQSAMDSFSDVVDQKVDYETRMANNLLSQAGSREEVDALRKDVNLDWVDTDEFRLNADNHELKLQEQMLFDRAENAYQAKEAAHSGLWDYEENLRNISNSGADMAKGIMANEGFSELDQEAVSDIIRQNTFNGQIDTPAVLQAIAPLTRNPDGTPKLNKEGVSIEGIVNQGLQGITQKVHQNYVAAEDANLPAINQLQKAAKEKRIQSSTEKLQATKLAKKQDLIEQERETMGRGNKTDFRARAIALDKGKIANYSDDLGNVYSDLITGLKGKEGLFAKAGFNATDIKHYENTYGNTLPKLIEDYLIDHPQSDEFIFGEAIALRDSEAVFLEMLKGMKASGSIGYPEKNTAIFDTDLKKMENQLNGGR